jgi:lysophospholipase L1-like esterase
VSEARRWRSWLGSLLLAGASVLLVLVAFELGVRALGYEPIYAVYSHPEQFWQKDELLGWSLRPDSKGKYIGPRPWPVEFEAMVEINSQGLRGPEIGERPAGGVRILFLGDSAVAAFEVPYEKTFASLTGAQLERELGIPVQVINAGVRGYGSDQSYLYFRERGVHLAPDIVVMFYVDNDLADNVTLHRMRRIFGKGALALRDGGALEPVGYPIPDYPICSEWLIDSHFTPRRIDTARESAICNVQTRLADRSALLTFFSIRIQQNPQLLAFLYTLGSPTQGAELLPRGNIKAVPGAPPADVAPTNALHDAILLAITREAHAHGADFVLPLPGPFGGNPQHPEALRAAGATTFTIPENLGDVKFHYQHDSHLNPVGHQAVADALTPVLAELVRARRAR